MKKLFLLLAIVLIYSCSSNDDSVVESNYFKYTFDGKEVNVKNWIATKYEKRFKVEGVSEDGESFGIIFNIYGNLTQAFSDPNNSSIPASWSYVYYKSNYFKIDSIEVDELNKRVSIEFSGDLYEDEYDLDSNKHTVKGGFSVEYVDDVLPISGIETSANINGKQWYGTNSDSEGGFFSGSDIQLNESSDDEYQLSFFLNHDNTTESSYNFDSNSTVNKVKLFKFDVNRREYVEFETEGILTITEKEVGPTYTIITANFNLLATKGGETITVSEGKIRTAYDNY